MPTIMKCNLKNYSRQGMHRVVRGQEFVVEDKLAETLMKDYPEGFKVIKKVGSARAVKQAQPSMNKQAIPKADK